MPIINRVAEFHPEITKWRQALHSNPELLYDVHETAAFVADKLKGLGVDEVHTGIGQTGVVGIIHGRQNGIDRVIGLRADMDALPITERTGKAYASQIDGKMHACGHDGHTAMLLGAAQYLAETRNFDGKVVLIFQPAEEGGAGAKAMLDDGLASNFGIQEVYGLHNMPGIPVGKLAVREGSMMAATDEFNIEITGVGGHAAMPQQAIDPILIAAHMIVGLQSIVSRNVNPLQSAVLSVTTVNAGTAHNIIPKTASLRGTVRTLDEDVRNQMEARMQAVVPQMAAVFGAQAELTYRRGYPVTRNTPENAAFATEVAREVLGSENVITELDPLMGGEDFAYMLERWPGAYVFLGNGDSSPLHTDTYDFNDDAIGYGVSFFVRLVEKAMPMLAPIATHMPPPMR